MRKYILGFVISLLSLGCFLFSAYRRSEPVAYARSVAATSLTGYQAYARNLYASAHLKDSGLSFPVFEKALTGYLNLKQQGRLAQHPLLGIADFDQLSTRKRLYVLDVKKGDLVMNTWVAHGQRSGEDETVRFSNQQDSFSSSIGFYVTGETYTGVHGRSLRLDGMDAGYNDNARMRSIVIHGAPYVSEGTIDALGRLGRSQGCPAVSPECSDKLIGAMGEGSVLFINRSREKYASEYLDEKQAALAMTPTPQLSLAQGQESMD